MLNDRLGFVYGSLYVLLLWWGSIEGGDIIYIRFLCGYIWLIEKC